MFSRRFHTLGSAFLSLTLPIVGLGPLRVLAADANNYVSVSVTDPSAPTPAITVNMHRLDHWSIPKTNALVYRVDTLDGAGNWSSPVASLPWGTNSYVDTNVEVGKRYLYRVVTDGPSDRPTVKSYVTGGIATPVVDNRGIMLLVTDNVTAPQLVPEITQFKQDLIGDGYRVQEISVSPTDTPQAVKAKIVAAYQANPSLVKSVTLLGNVPVPHSGWVNPDGHGSRPYPTDSYYADVNGTWTDSSRNSNNTSGNHPWWVNTPGDGKLDQSKTPSHLDLQIGRISFNNMPVFAESEVELMRRYLEKNHAYRHNEFSFNSNLMVAQEDSLTGYSASGPLFGTANRPFVPTIDAARSAGYWNEAENNSYWLSTWYRGGGTYTSTWGIGTAADFAQSPGVNIAIQSAWASYYGEWDVQNAFLRAILAAKGQTVATFYEGNPAWVLYALGMGETIGYAAQMSINQNGLDLNPTSLNYADSIISGVLGDPSIRLFPVTPPTQLTAEDSGGSIALSWEASDDEDIVGYYVYRAGSWDAEFVRISEELISGLSFIDDDPLDQGLYMVRAIKLQETGSGTYFDASQGIFALATSIPEPASVLLVIAGGIIVTRRHHTSRNVYQGAPR